MLLLFFFFFFSFFERGVGGGGGGRGTQTHKKICLGIFVEIQWNLNLTWCQGTTVFGSL